MQVKHKCLLQKPKKELKITMPITKYTRSFVCALTGKRSQEFECDDKGFIEDFTKVTNGWRLYDLGESRFYVSPIAYELIKEMFKEIKINEGWD